jgi:hypothetical protein
MIPLAVISESIWSSEVFGDSTYLTIRTWFGKATVYHADLFGFAFETFCHRLLMIFFVTEAIQRYTLTSAFVLVTPQHRIKRP